MEPARRVHIQAVANAYDLIAVAVIAVDEGGSVVYANARGRTMLAEASTLPIAVARTHQNPLLHTVSTPSGKLSAFEVSWTPLPNDAGVRIATVRPVSDERRALAALTESEAFFSDVFDAFPGSVITLDETGAIVLANAQWRISARVNGLSLPNDGVGCNYLAACDLATGADREIGRRVANGIRAVLTRKQMLFETDYALTGTPDDRWCRVIVIPLDHPGVLVVHTEITSSVHDHAKLRESEHRFRAIFDRALEGMVLFDDDLCIAQANGSAERIFGYEPGGLVGRNASALLGGADIGLFGVEWSKARMQRATPLIVQTVKRTGDVVRIEASLSHDIAAGRHLLVVRDVTEEWRLSEELRQSQKLEVLGRFSAGIAHDFNNLLTVILANAEELRGDSDAPAAEIRRAAQDGAALIQRIMAFSRHSTFTLETLDLHDLLEQLHPLLRRLLPTSIDVQTRSAPGLWVVASPISLEQIVMNLATNSRDAMPRGGSFTVSASFATNGHDVELRVADS